MHVQSVESAPKILAFITILGFFFGGGVTKSSNFIIIQIAF